MLQRQNARPPHPSGLDHFHCIYQTPRLISPRYAVSFINRGDKTSDNGLELTRAHAGEAATVSHSKESHGLQIISLENVCKTVLKHSFTLFPGLTIILLVEGP